MGKRKRRRKIAAFRIRTNESNEPKRERNGKKETEGKKERERKERKKERKRKEGKRENLTKSEREKGRKARGEKGNKEAKQERKKSCFYLANRAKRKLLLRSGRIIPTKLLAEPAKQPSLGFFLPFFFPRAGFRPKKENEIERKKVRKKEIEKERKGKRRKEKGK